MIERTTQPLATRSALRRWTSPRSSNSSLGRVLHDREPVVAHRADPRTVLVDEVAAQRGERFLQMRSAGTGAGSQAASSQARLVTTEIDVGPHPQVALPPAEVDEVFHNRPTRCAARVDHHDPIDRGVVRVVLLAEHARRRHARRRGRRRSTAADHRRSGLCRALQWWRCRQRSAPRPRGWQRKAGGRPRPRAAGSPRTAGEGGAHGWTNYACRNGLVNSGCQQAERVWILGHEIAGHLRCDHDHRRDISRAQQGGSWRGRLSRWAERASCSPVANGATSRAVHESSSGGPAWRVGFSPAQHFREGRNAMSCAMFSAVSAVPNDDGRRAGFRQPDDASARWTSGWRPPLTVGHRPGPAHREGSA